MKISLFLIAAIGCLLLASSSYGQANNYLLLAHDAAMERREPLESFLDEYREHLVSESGFVGTSHLAELLYWLDEQEENFATGDKARYCTEMYSEMSWTLIQQGHEILGRLLTGINGFHQSVAEELMATNIMNTNLDDFYYFHTLRLDQTSAALDVISTEIVDHMDYMWYETANIAWELYECLNAYD